MAKISTGRVRNPQPATRRQPKITDPAERKRITTLIKAHNLVALNTTSDVEGERSLQAARKYRKQIDG